MSEELTQGEILANEQDFLKGLLDAGNDAQSMTVPITVKRNGKRYFTFRIRPLTETEYNKAREKATKYQLNKQLGIKIPDSRDDAEYRNQLIYAATVPEDRSNLWDRKEAWTQFNVLSGPDLIERVLLPGEKLAIVSRLDELSGYGMDLEETAKNS